MANITIRNIPDDVFEKIRRLSSVERRSINNELLVIIERGIISEVEESEINIMYFENFGDKMHVRFTLSKEGKFQGSHDYTLKLDKKTHQRIFRKK